jgi:hypothetical protein
LRKSIIILFLVSICLSVSATENSKEKEQEQEKERNFYENLYKYFPKINGDINFVLKNQKSYRSPFDVPAWGWDQRAGASNRDSQFMRSDINLYLSSGELGESEFFAVISFWGDPNNPDNISGDYDSNVGASKYEEVIRNKNIEEKKLELSNAFLMWRPYKYTNKKGEYIGRPFGITAGYQTIKATANGAYTNIFSGDLDKDFIAYTVTALQDKPMLHLDFHINENTGLGYSFAKGLSDMTSNITAYDDEYSFTHVLYGEAKKNNFGFNAAWQISKGNREVTNPVFTEYGDNWYMVNGEDSYGTYETASYKYTTHAINTAVSYEYAINEKHKIKPFIVYQKIWGEEASPKKYQEIGEFETKKAEAEVGTLGFVYSTNVGKYNIRFSTEYSDIKTPDFNGIDGVQDGQIDDFVGAAGVPYFDQAKMMNGENPLGESYKMEHALFADIAGDSEAAYTMVGLDKMLHFELAVDINENFTLSIFYNLQKTQKPKKLKTSKEQKEELAKVFDEELGYLRTAEAEAMGLSPGFSTGEVPTAELLAENVANNLDSINAFGTEWKDSSSVGLGFKYKF